MIRTAWTTFKGKHKTTILIDHAWLEEWPVFLTPNVTERVPPGCEVHKSKERTTYIEAGGSRHHLVTDPGIEFLRRS